MVAHVSKFVPFASFSKYTINLQMSNKKRKMEAKDMPILWGIAIIGMG
jgi:hypothetical protein